VGGGERGASGQMARAPGTPRVGGGGGVSISGARGSPAAEATVASGAAGALGGVGEGSDLGHVICWSQPGPKQSRPDIVTAPACATLSRQASAVSATSTTAIVRARGRSRLATTSMPPLYLAVMVLRKSCDTQDCTRGLEARVDGHPVTPGSEAPSGGLVARSRWAFSHAPRQRFLCTTRYPASVHAIIPPSRFQTFV
jgi:hypothetical protein